MIEVRPPEGIAQRITLAFQWTEAEAARAYVRILNIYKLVTVEGYSLKQAAEIAAGKAPKLIEQLDWTGALERFKDQKVAPRYRDKDRYVGCQIFASFDRCGCNAHRPQTTNNASGSNRPLHHEMGAW